MKKGRNKLIRPSDWGLACTNRLLRLSLADVVGSSTTPVGYEAYRPSPSAPSACHPMKSRTADGEYGRTPARFAAGPANTGQQVKLTP
jgi:hypothetical protein